MNDLRKRAAGILEYVTRTQVELTTIPAAVKESPETSTSHESIGTAPANAESNGVGKPGQLSKTKHTGTLGGLENMNFTDMSSREMMDILTRELVLWQKTFGKYGDKDKS